LKDLNVLKEQWRLIVGLIIVIIIAVFAIMNVEEVPVSFIIGEARWPLILVILGSALLGVIISTCFAGIKIFKMQRTIQELKSLVPNYEQVLAHKKAQEEKLRAEKKAKEAEKKAEREEKKLKKVNDNV
jgi:putative membrane protein